LTGFFHMKRHDGALLICDLDEVWLNI